MKIKAALPQQGQDLVLNLHVQPNAARTEFVGWQGEAIKIRLHAPPVDDKANQELCRFLAETFAVKRQSVVLLSGEASRAKRVRMTNLTSLPRFITLLLQGGV